MHLCSALSQVYELLLHLLALRLDLHLGDSQGSMQPLLHRVLTTDCQLGTGADLLIGATLWIRMKE